MSSGRPVTRVKIGPLDPEQRSAVADFFGMARYPPEFVSLSLSAVEVVLQEATGSSVREVVERLVGPIGDRSADRARAAAERKMLWDWLADHKVVRAQPALESWVEATRRAGLIGGSVENTRVELERALNVMRELPAAGTPLPIFADKALGNPHGLDADRPVHGLVVRALASVHGRDLPTDTAALRALWDRAGLAADELSSTVLAAGPLAGPDSLAGRILSECARAGTAAVLTLQQLRTSERLDAVPDRVWIVENPSVLALALNRFGPECPPLVCTSGWPRGAAVLLLERLAAAGAKLFYHGDFDGDGLRIAAHVVARIGALPWRMSSADYLAAVGGDAPAVGRVSPVPWDSELAQHLRRTGRSVPEERVASVLLDELERIRSSRL